MGLKSYDDVIKRLARSRAGLPDSLFGVCRGSRPFEREKEDERCFQRRKRHICAETGSPFNSSLQVVR